jgi:hypothetical protein
MASSNKEINPLHKAASYTTIFTLSGITESEIRDHSFLKNAPHDIIARSGGIGENARISSGGDPFAGTGGANADDKIVRDAYKDFTGRYQDSISILKRSHDMFIENVNIISTVSPNAERNLANFTKMEFEVHEPYGITLIEKVRAATALNGFQDYQDAPLLLTIEFKGFDDRGRPLMFGTGGSMVGGLTRKIPILIARVDFDVNEGGAKYSVVAVPYTDLGFDDRFKFPRTSLIQAGNKAEDWCIDVAAQLDVQMEQEIAENKRQFKDTYIFKIDPEVSKNGLDYQSVTDSIANTSTAEQHDEIINIGGGYKEIATNKLQGLVTGTQYKSTAKADSFTALTKFFEDAVRQSFGYLSLVQNFWVGYLTSLGHTVTKDDTDKIRSIIRSKKFQEDVAKEPFVPWFKVKPTVETDTTRFDNITKMHPKTIIYRAMPYKIHILKLIGSGMSLKTDWSKYVRKEYNYLYTGDNLDVQGLRINYKTAYYMRNVREAKDTTEAGIFEELKQTILEAFGQEKDPEPTLPLRQYPSIIKGRSTVSTTNPENLKAQEFYDYLTNPEADMMRIELEILGDPAYICQDMYMPVDDKEKDKTPTTTGGGTGPFNYKDHSFNADQFMTCINLRYRLPDDIDEKEGIMFSGTQKFRDENLFFSGVYQVVKVDSKMDNGQFMQTLTCVRMNNQTGEGLPVELVNSARIGNDILKSAKSDAVNKFKGFKTRHGTVENITTKVNEKINEVTKIKKNIRGFKR